MNLVTHFHLAPNVKNVWSCTSTYLYVFTAWCLIKHRDNFTFYLNVMIILKTLLFL